VVGKGGKLTGMLRTSRLGRMSECKYDVVFLCSKSTLLLLLALHFMLALLRWLHLWHSELPVMLLLLSTDGMAVVLLRMSALFHEVRHCWMERRNRYLHGIYKEIQIYLEASLIHSVIKLLFISSLTSAEIRESMHTRSRPQLSF